ncbi:SipW-dependent-type signal peptide-containing protein [Curtobacterium sp. VKM Ac-1376]|uniref:SipW-dependent-type signal peptide-containing protein n=1 Tax=Curtobacterium sp. VKM Ac-1376 TaxID=123312 RepID=UPI001E2FA70E|nr:SipW-dependent-type signal peptide-containing protein [Curtobacterium sp. VKM Ac-1376]
MADTTARPRARRRNRALALAAGGVLVIGGAGYTLASWTDTEWVFGGTDSGGPAVGTSGFDVEQNVTAPFATGDFGSDATNPGQALRFTIDALALSPGTATYAPSRSAPPQTRSRATSPSGPRCRRPPSR